METNIQTKKTAAKKVSARTKVVETDPFADAVDETVTTKVVAG